MRWRHLTLWEMKLQAKYGFYLLYGLLTALYLGVLFALPQAWREKAAALLIFSDPAAMGLFFMGAIVLLEKSQRLPSALAVSPVRAMEYVTAKVVSLGIISLAVAALPALAAGGRRLPATLLGTALAGAVFTLLGIILATKITSLNQFLLWAVPVETAGMAPAVLHLFGVSPAALRFYPPNVCMDLIAGNRITAAGLLVTLGLIAGLLAAARRSVLNLWNNGGIPATPPLEKPRRFAAAAFPKAPVASTRRKNRACFLRGFAGRQALEGKRTAARAVWLNFRQMLRFVRRDRMLFAACAAPLLAGLFFRFGIPLLEQAVSVWAGVPALLCPYYGLFDLIFSLLTPLMFCFASAMVMLEERDDRIQAYLFVTGLGKKGYLASRLGLPALFAFLVTAALLPLFQLTPLSPAAILLLALSGALQGVVTALLIVTLSANKLEGMTVTKMSSLMILGAFAPYFLPSGLQYAASFLPAFWMAKTLQGGGLLGWIFSLLTAGIWIFLLLRIFLKKIN